MKKVLLFAAALMITGSMSQVLAGSACCPASKVKADKVAKAECGEDCFAGLDLTADQKTKMAALMSDCEGTECDVTSAKKMKKGLAGILTAEQMKSLQSQCDEKGCGLADTGAKSGADA